MVKERDSLYLLRQILSSAPIYENQLLYPITGERKWVVRKGQPWPRCLADGNYLYVVVPDGEIRFSELPRPQSNIHHPELVKGKQVIAAGIFKMFDGKIIMINNESGHYMPDMDSVYLAKMTFKILGRTFG